MMQLEVLDLTNNLLLCNMKYLYPLSEHETKSFFKNTILIVNRVKDQVVPVVNLDAKPEEKKTEDRAAKDPESVFLRPSPVGGLGYKGEHLKPIRFMKAPWMYKVKNHSLDSVLDL